MDEGDWHGLVETLAGRGIVTRRDIALAVLEGINPPQVGTSMTGPAFQAQLGAGDTWSAVREWLYAQPGRCPDDDCGTRVSLQADHIDTVQAANEAVAAAQAALDAGGNDEEVEAELRVALERAQAEAKTIHHPDRMQLVCRRHNVARRPSHAFGGSTELPTAAAMMWILFTYEPRTISDFERMCRAYGLTMANIRIEEGWAMAEWLTRDADYLVDRDAGTYDIEVWGNGALTRRPTGEPRSADAPEPEKVFGQEPPTAVIGFVTKTEPPQPELRFHEVSVTSLAMSVYTEPPFAAAPWDLDTTYKRVAEDGAPPQWVGLRPPPRDDDLQDIAVRSPNQRFCVEWKEGDHQRSRKQTNPGSRGGRKVQIVTPDTEPAQLALVGLPH